MDKKALSFFLIVVAIFIGMVGPSLFSNGMFMDGLLYATISKNLAHHLGSFWDLHLSATLYPHFHEHPPLAFGIQSLFFGLFGDSLLVERFYSLITFFITGWIIISIWKQTTDKKFHSLGWLPVLLWLSIPLVTWAVSNNMLENTMTIFISLSVLFIIKSSYTKRFLYLSLSGFMVFLGLLTKGPVALFPLSLPFWLFVVKHNINLKRFLIDTLVLCGVILVSFSIMFILTPDSINSLTAYFNRQIVGSLKNIKTVDSRFQILWRLFTELIPAGILVVLAFIFSKKSITVEFKSNWKFVFVALGFSGVLPIMVSLKQSGFYIVPAFPFFSIALSAFIAPRVYYLINKISTHTKGYTIFTAISYMLLAISIILATMQVNKIGRDKNKINDVYTIIKVIPDNSTLSVEPDLWTDWSLHGYFGRYANISLDDKDHYHKYFLIKKNDGKKLLRGYKKIPINLRLYTLYEKKNR